MREWDEINEYYRNNPPQCTIDHDGIRHWNEVPMPAKYKIAPCSCGLVHPVESNSWYHSTMELFKGTFVVIKKCKTCHEALVKVLDE